MYIIIDGSSMLTTNYYGTLPRELVFARSRGDESALYSKIMQTSDGKYTNGVYTSLKQILRIIKQQNPEGVIVVLDKSRDTFRREIYSDYKAQRPATPKPLNEQFITFAEVLSAIGIPVFCSSKYEADDLAGAIAKNLEKAGKECILISGDKDYYQLVSDKTYLWRLMPSTAKSKYEKVYGVNLKEYWEENKIPTGMFETKLGDEIMLDDALVNLTPEQFIDYLAVAGDKADNIPGVRGVGTMTIVPLLQAYGSLTAIYQAIDNSQDHKALVAEWKAKYGIKSNPINALKKYKDDAMLSRTLAQIKTDIDEVPSDVNAYNLNLNRDGLKQVIEKYEFASLKDII
jgi:DNA polymerase-1